jgi:hypothetical protein
MVTRLFVRTTLLVLLAGVAACTANPDATGGPRYDANVLTRADLEASNASNAYEAIERLRPRWLVPRVRSANMPVEVVVYFNNSAVGGVAALRQFSLDGIVEIRYLDPAEAQNRLPAGGMSLNGGAIQIRTTAGPR